MPICPDNRLCCSDFQGMACRRPTRQIGVDSQPPERIGIRHQRRLDVRGHYRWCTEVCISTWSACSCSSFASVIVATTG